jgi:spore coat protein U-like protein
MPVKQFEHRRRHVSRATVGCLAVVGLAFGAGAPGPAWAGADCSVTSVGLAFGAYDPIAPTADDTAATVTVTCVYVPPGARSVSYTIMLSDGMGGAGSGARQMASGRDRLAYDVYTDPARTRAWGSGGAGTVVATGSMTVGPGVGNGTRTATHVVYGRTPALQDAAPGTYLDALVLTLAY